MSELDHIRWHCRRGLLELDLVLTRFLERDLARLSPAERDAFKALLDYPDNQLWDLVSGRLEPEPGSAAAVVKLMRDG